MDKQTRDGLLRLVRDNYEQIAENYNETRKKRPGQWESLKEAVVFKEDFNVLDAGCGNGRLLDIFPVRKDGYIGIDQSGKLIDCARKLHPGYDFRQGDILNLGNLPEYGFDLVFMVAVFHHFPGEDLRVSVLRQLKNKIKPGGRIVLTVWNMWSEKWEKKDFSGMIRKFALLKLIGKNKMDFGDIIFDWKDPDGLGISRRYYHAFTKRELKKISKKAGLAAERIIKDNYNYIAVLGRK